MLAGCAWGSDVLWPDRDAVPLHYARARRKTLRHNKNKLSGGRMTLFDDAVNTVQGAAESGAAAASDAAAAGEAMVDAVVDAATQAGDSAADAAEEAADDTTAAVIQIVDAAISLAGAAAAATAAAGASASDTLKRQAEFARFVALVGSLVAVIGVVVVIVVAVAIAVFTFGATAGAVGLAASLAATIAGATATVITVAIAIGAVIAAAGAVAVQGAVIAACRLLEAASAGRATLEERRRAARDALGHLKQAMLDLQGVAARRVPAKVTNVEVSLAAAERMAGVLGRLVVLLRRRRPTQRWTLLASRLDLLARAQAGVVAELRRVRLTTVVSAPRPAAPGATVQTPGLKR